MSVEDSPSIGQALAQARERAGLSVDEVSARTRLRGTVIRAIEGDDFAPCGGDFYARAHIREIARVVGADPAGLVAQFDASRAAVDAPAVSAVFDVDRAAARAERRAKPNWTAVMAVVLLALVGFGAYQIVASGSGSGSRQAGDVVPPASASPTPHVTPTPTAKATHTAAPSPSASPGTAPPDVVAEAPVTVVLDVTSATCWVKAWGSDGSVLYQGLMQPGDAKTLTDSSLVKLKLGNAPATNLTVNGVDIGAPPSKDMVTTVSFGPGDPTQAQG